MYIFGGNDIRDGMMNNLWSFNLASLEGLKEGNNTHESMEMAWQTLRTHGQIPEAISHHQSIVAGKNMYLIGGSMLCKDYNQS